MKKRWVRRILSTILVVCVMTTAVPVSLLAEETEGVAARAETEREMTVYDVGSDYRITYVISVTQSETGEETAIIKGFGWRDTEITALTIPETLGGYPVVGIGNGVFSGCTFLTKVVIPDSVTTIGYYVAYDSTPPSGAFEGCTSLTEITLPKSLTTIGVNAFARCRGLTEITIPESVTEIGDYAFNGCESLTDITLPDSLTRVGRDAFSNTEWLREQKEKDPMVIAGSILIDGRDCSGRVVVPDGVTAIASRAFSDVESSYDWPAAEVTEVVLPEGVTTIGDLAFYGCWSLTEVVLPESITTIGVAAFDNCRGLANITLPKNLTTIGYGAFVGTPLTEVTVPNGVTSLDRAFAGCWSLATVVLPESITSLRGTFDGCTSLTEITIPKNVTEIEDSAFRGCTSLTEVSIPDGVTVIGYRAFNGCTSLTEVSIPDSVTKIGRDIEYDTEVYDGDGAFEGCVGLTEITLPKSLTTIGASAFKDCTGLTEVSIPDGVTTIGDKAFYGCTSLIEVAIPDSVTTIGYDTTWNGMRSDRGVFAGCTSLKAITLSKSLTVIGIYLFQGCTGLTEITIPDGVTTIGYNAFSGCTSLTEITIPESVTTINGAFSGCTSLTEITIPESVTTINDAFYDCTSLTEITIPESVTTINDAFYGCISLTEITIPESVTTIKNAFSGCTSLTEITIPESVTTIDYAFKGCTSLTEITIPGSVESMYAAFSGCTSLAEVTILDGVTSVSGEAFRDCTSLTMVRIPESVTTIKNAFSGCTSLTEITLPDSLTAIEGNAFGGCIGLETIFLPDGIESISSDAFSECPQITLHVVPDSYAEQYAIENGISYEHYINDSAATLRVTLSLNGLWMNLSGLSLTVENGDYHASRRLSSDLQYRFGGVLIGEGYTVAVSNEYGDVLAQLENVSVQAGINQIEIQEFAPFADANVCVWTENEEDVTAQCSVAWLDEDGNPYASGALLSKVPVGKRLLCRIKLDEELSKMYAEPEDTAYTVSAQGSGCSVRLKTLEVEADSVALNILAEYTARADEGETAETQDLSSLSGLAFAIFNTTSGLSVNRYIIQGNGLFFSEGVDAGDVLTVTVSSRKGDFAPESATVTIGDDKTANAEFTFTQRGALKANYERGQNKNVRLLIYGADGSLAWTGTDEKSGGLQSESLPDGTYTALAIGESRFLAYPDSLQGILDLGLRSGQDYVEKQVQIVSGKNTAAAFGAIPLFSEERYYVTNPQETLFSLSKLEAGVGTYVTLRAQAPLKAEYEGRIRDVKWIFKLPAQCELISGTLSANGESCRDVTYDGDEMFVAVERADDFIRMCVMPLEMGSYTLSGSLQYTLDGKTFCQPVGRLTLKADEAGIELPSKTMSKQVTVSGRAIAQSEVFLYDNGELAGQTMANKNGRWSADIELVRPYTYSEHGIYAEVHTKEGQVFLTEEKPLTYQYTKEPASVGRVKMINQFHGGEENVIVFDFQGNALSNTFYNYDPTSPTFTFLVEMAQGDVKKISGMRLFVHCSDGSTRMLYPSFDAKKNQWVISESFSFNALPQSVRVDYDYETEMVHSAEAQEDISKQWIVFYKFIKDDGGLVIDPPEDLPNDVKEDIKKYNEEIEKAKKSADKLKEKTRYKQDGTSVSVETNNVKFESKDVSDRLPSDAQLASEGYEKKPSTSPDHLVYTRVTEDTTDTIIVTKDENGETIAAQTSVTVGDVEQAMAEVNQIAECAEECSENLLSARQAAEKAEATAKAAEKAGYASVVLTSAYSHLVENKAVLEVLTRSPKIAADLPRLQMWGKVLSVVSVASGIYEYNKNNNTIQKLHQIHQNYCKKQGNNCSCMNKLMRDFASYQILKLGNITYSSVGLFARATPIGFAVGLGLSTADYFWGNSLNKEAAELNGRCKPCEECESEDDPKDPAYQELYLGQSVTGIVDPSGVVYEAVLSNRLSGVTVSCYEKTMQEDLYGNEQEDVALWDAKPYDQQNPLVTGADGSYAWDVPQGAWQVRCEKEGYEAASSSWMDVPPPQFDINIGMVSREEPSLDGMLAYPDEIILTFGKYMKTDTVSADAVHVTSEGRRIGGTLTPLDAENSPTDGTLLAKRFSFTPDQPLSKGEQVTVEIAKSVCSYAGIQPSADLQAQADVALRPQSFTVTPQLSLSYDGEGELAISASPAEAAAGREVVVTGGSALMVEIAERTVTLDNSGKASVHVKAQLPGQCLVSFALSGSDLSAQSVVTIGNLNEGESGGDDGTVALADCRVRLERDSYVYDGSPKCPAVSVTHGTIALAAGTDYVVSYSGNTNAGTAYALVSGRGRCTGEIRLPFAIQKADNVITAFDIEKTVSAKKQTASISASCSGGSGLTYESSHKSVAVSEDGTLTIAKNFIGKAVITIRAAASENYKEAEQNINVVVNPAGTKLSKLTEQGKGKIKVTWKKAKKADGYEIQYATDKKFAGSFVKTAKVKKKNASTCVLSKLKKGKTYYVRIRAYKKASGEIYVSAWSKQKKIKKKY